MLESNQTSLSTEVNYIAKEIPSNIKVETGKYYKLIDNYGTIKEVKITALRRLGDDVIVYYQYPDDNDKSWLGKNITASLPINTFKMGMVDYGAIDSVEVIYR